MTIGLCTRFALRASHFLRRRTGNASYQRMVFTLTSAPSGQFLTLTGDFVIGRSIRTYGEWSYGELEALEQFCKPDSNILEAGANIGSHTVFIARDFCPQGRVFAFEPRRVLFQLLCANLMLNGITNVHAYQKAVGATEAEMEEGPLPIDQQQNFGANPLGNVHGTGEIFRIVPLDSMIAELPRIALIKADVEGHEADLLRGAQKLIARDRPILYLENDRGDKSEELMTLVSGLGYRIFWHIVPMVRKDNFSGSPEVIFPEGMASINIMCLPRERALNVHGAAEITDFKDFPIEE